MWIELGAQCNRRSQWYYSDPRTQQASELLQKALSLSEEERAELAGSLSGTVAEGSIRRLSGRVDFALEGEDAPRQYHRQRSNAGYVCRQNQ